MRWLENVHTWGVVLSKFVFWEDRPFMFRKVWLEVNRLRPFVCVFDL